MTLLYPCTKCDRGLTVQRDTTCNRCWAEFEAEWNPIDRPKTLPMEPPRGVRAINHVTRALAWLTGKAHA